VTVVATSFDMPAQPEARSRYVAAPPAPAAEESSYGKFRVAAPPPKEEPRRPRKFWSRF